MPLKIAASAAEALGVTVGYFDELASRKAAVAQERSELRQKIKALTGCAVQVETADGVVVGTVVSASAKSLWLIIVYVDEMLPIDAVRGISPHVTVAA